MRRAKEEQLGGATQFYSTPSWAVHRLLDVHPLPPGPFIELGCGVGGIVRAVNSWEAWRDGALVRPYASVTWTGFELDRRIAQAGSNRMADECVDIDVVVGDALTVTATDIQARACLQNPPNDLAEEFVLKGLELAEEVLVFQPQQFYASSGRESFFASHPPDWIYVLPDRPRFAGASGAMQCYAWHCFSRRPTGMTRTRRLGLTDKALRASEFARQMRENAEDFGSSEARAEAPEAAE